MSHDLAVRDGERPATAPRFDNRAGHRRGSAPRSKGAPPMTDPAAPRPTTDRVAEYVAVLVERWGI